MKTLLKIFLLFLLTISIYTNAVAQKPVTWQKVFDNPETGLDGINGICEADSGNFFLTGFTLIPSYGYKIWIIKINPFGDTLWTRTVGINGGKAYSVASSGDGGCVLTGSANQAFAIKIDQNGNIVWERYYGGLGVQLKKIKNTSDGGYIACGRINLQDGYILKISSSGFFQWEKVIPSNYLTYFFDVDEDRNSGFVLCGFEIANIQDTSKAIILKIDNFGELVWQNKYKFKEQTSAYSIKKIDNLYLVGGSTGTVSVTIGKVYFCKLDSNGNIIFTKIFETKLDEYFGDMTIINENKYVIAMSRDSSASLYGKALITNSIGEIINQRIFATSNFIIFNSILNIPNGGLIFCANADFQIPGAEQVGYVIRTDSTLFLKTVRVENINIIADRNFNLYQNYPNPFNSDSKIKYEIKKKRHYKMNLYDVNGRLISVLLDGIVNPGFYEIDLGNYFRNLSSSVYYVSLELENQVLTRKLVLLK